MRGKFLTGMAFLMLCFTVGEAQACPSCKNANETDSRLPMAYQTSIIFMLSVPMMIFSGFGIGLYRLNKAQEKAVAEFENGDAWINDPEFDSPHEPESK